jgi:hypothetical protein
VKLFDTIARTDTSPPRSGEHPYNWLNESCLPDVVNIRDLLEEWFADYPTGEQQNLKNTLQNEAYSHHLGAWWELYVFTVYRKLGFSVDLHPAVPGTDGRPDFLVTKDDASYYVECTVVSPSEHNGARDEPSERWIHTALNTVTSRHFHLGVSIERLGREEPSIPKVIRDIEDWLSTLDPEVWLSPAPQLAITPKDWEVTAHAYPIAAANRADGGRFLGVLPPDRRVVINDVNVIRDKLEEKGGHYGKRPDKPLVVALVSTTEYTEDYDVTAALFGRRENISDRPEVVTIARRRNGYWRPPPAVRGARVSGVLFGQRLNHWTVASAFPKLWLNPWANEPLILTDPFSVLTRAADASGPIIETLGSGDPSIFGLPASWPY